MSICSWLRKASCLIWTEKNVTEKRKKKTGMRRRLRCGLHFNLWVSHKRQEGTKRETILGWLPWQHNKQEDMNVSIAMPSVCKDKYHVPQSSFTVRATLVYFVAHSLSLFSQGDVLLNLPVFTTRSERWNTFHRFDLAIAAALYSQST